MVTFNGKAKIWGVVSIDDFVVLGWCQWLFQVPFTSIVEKFLEVKVIYFLMFEQIGGVYQYLNFVCWKMQELLAIHYLLYLWGCFMCSKQADEVIFRTYFYIRTKLTTVIMLKHLTILTTLNIVDISKLQHNGPQC